jgi:hypothetical protein
MATFYLNPASDVVKEVAKYRRSIKKINKDGSVKLDQYDYGHWFDNITRSNMLEIFYKLYNQIIYFATKFNKNIDDAISILNTTPSDSTLSKLSVNIIKTLEDMKIDIFEDVNDITKIPPTTEDTTKKRLLDDVYLTIETITKMSDWTTTNFKTLENLHELRVILSYVSPESLEKIGAGTDARATKLLTTLAFVDNLSLRYGDIGFRSVYLKQFYEKWQAEEEEEDKDNSENNEKLMQEAEDYAAYHTYSTMRLEKLNQRKMDSLFPTSCVKCQQTSLDTLKCEKTCNCNEKTTMNDKAEFEVDLNSMSDKLLKELKNDDYVAEFKSLKEELKGKLDNTIIFESDIEKLFSKFEDEEPEQKHIENSEDNTSPGLTKTGEETAGPAATAEEPAPGEAPAALVVPVVVPVEVKVPVVPVEETAKVKVPVYGAIKPTSSSRSKRNRKNTSPIRNKPKEIKNKNQLN